ncbi:MAG: F0F1 ATP synthase subunit B' [Pseudomonadota bacterium]
MATESTLGADAASACVDGGGGAVGMPQLCPDWFANQIFWLVITLVVIFLILSRIALPRIAGVLAERQGTITNDLAAAEDFKAKAVAAEDAYNKALADARAQAQEIVAQTKAEIREELAVATQKADEEIAARTVDSEAKIAEIREGALQGIKDVAKDTAKELISAMGVKADARSVTTAVNTRLKG